MTAIQRTGLWPDYSISRLIKGGWHLAGGHGEVDQTQAIDDMARFVEAGITTFDCADHYTGVEELIGDFRAAYPDLAPKIQIHTKFVPDLGTLETCDGAYVERIIDRSLQRLRVERLDLVQFHWWDFAVARHVEIALHLEDLRQSGKIDRIGVTNYDMAHLGQLLDAGVPVAVHQLQYSLIDDRPEHGMVAFCKDHGIALLCYGTLAGGFFAPRWLGAAEPQTPFTNRSLTKYKLIIDEFGGWDLFQQLLSALDMVATRHGVSIGQVAVRWLLDRPGAAAAIVGATSTRHLAANEAIFGLALDQEDRDRIEDVLALREGPPGDCYGLERDREGPHGRIMRYNLNER